MYIPPSADLRHAVEVRVRPRCADDVRWFAASSDGSRRRSLSAHSFGRTIERNYPARDDSVNGNVDDARRPTEDSSGPLLEHPAEDRVGEQESDVVSPLVVERLGRAAGEKQRDEATALYY